MTGTNLLHWFASVAGWAALVCAGVLVVAIVVYVAADVTSWIILARRSRVVRKERDQMADEVAARRLFLKSLRERERDAMMADRPASGNGGRP
jgi:hypothetical protein